MSNSIQDAIVAAQQAAANSVAPIESTQVASYVDSGAPLGLEDMLSAGVSVDFWLKLTAFGIVIGELTKPVDDMEVYLELGSIAYCNQIKYQLNGSAKYHRSYDGRTENGTGTSWMEVLREAQQIDPKAYSYRSAEIPLLAAADIIGKDGKVAVEAGQTLGLTLPTTGWKPFEAFIKDVMRKGINTKEGVIKLTLGHKVMKKQGVNDWAIPQFLTYEEVDQLPAFGTVH